MSSKYATPDGIDPWTYHTWLILEDCEQFVVSGDVDGYTRVVLQAHAALSAHTDEEYLKTVKELFKVPVVQKGRTPAEQSLITNSDAWMRAYAFYGEIMKLLYRRGFTPGTVMRKNSVDGYGVGYNE